MFTHAGTKPPVVLIATPNVTFDVGDDLLLECKIKNTNLSITANWTREKNKQILKTANFSYDTKPGLLYHNLSYQLNEVSAADEGTYTCFANYFYGTQQASYRLRLKGKQGFKMSRRCRYLSYERVQHFSLRSPICITPTTLSTRCPAFCYTTLSLVKPYLFIFITSREVYQKLDFRTCFIPFILSLLKSSGSYGVGGGGGIR